MIGGGEIAWKLDFGDHFDNLPVSVRGNENHHVAGQQLQLCLWDSDRTVQLVRQKFRFWDGWLRHMLTSSDSADPCGFSGSTF
jgi:hypothetical protein